MTKRVASALLILFAFGVAVALAAVPPTTGKILAVDSGSIQITLDGEKAVWIKKNAPVKFEKAVGKILEVSEDGVVPVVIKVKTKKAADFTVGDPISFVKGQSMAGC
jgi:hypothetical protein